MRVLSRLSFFPSGWQPAEKEQHEGAKPKPPAAQQQQKGGGEAGKEGKGAGKKAAKGGEGAAAPPAPPSGTSQAGTSVGNHGLCRVWVWRVGVGASVMRAFGWTVGEGVLTLSAGWCGCRGGQGWRQGGWREEEGEEGGRWGRGGGQGGGGG